LPTNNMILAKNTDNNVRYSPYGLSVLAPMNIQLGVLYSV